MSPRPESLSKDANLLQNVDPNTVKIKKKPGRKPNPASPAMRKAQNRVAQRAFRERKERHLRELEDQIRDIRTQRDRVNKSNVELHATVDTFRNENHHLKNLVIVLQSALSQSGISIPEFSNPNTAPLQYPHNMLAPNVNTVMSAHAALNSQMPVNPLRFPNGTSISTAKPARYSISEEMVMAPAPQSSGYYETPYVKLSSSPENSPHFGWNTDGIPQIQSNSNDYSEPSPGLAFINTLFANQTNPVMNADTSALYSPELNYIDPALSTTPSPSLNSPLPAIIRIDANTQLGVPSHFPLSPHSAIQLITMQLRLQNASKASNIPFSIQPTQLQHSVPHDPRIDLMPSPHIRDRLIIFRDCYDSDECFQSLIDEARFYGGNPADPENWEVPANFFSDYWFLVIASDLKRTNKWRKKRGEKELEIRPPEGSYGKLGGGTDPAIDALLQESMSRLSTRDP